jgi:tetratricopeptide (TPR) repeat protein
LVSVLIHTPDQRLRVFVSSVLGELAEERRAVSRAVSALRLTPVMFESGARPHPPRDVYGAYLAQSDVFVGVYWQSYGWVGPGAQISGLHEEFELSRVLPRLLYLKVPAPGRESRLAELLASIDEEASGCYREFRTPGELGRLVREDLAALLSERFAASDGRISSLPDQERAPGLVTGDLARVPLGKTSSRDGPAESRGSLPSAAPGLVPRQLPPDVSHFTGRDADLAELDALLATAGAASAPVVISAIAGMAGIGKTSLAVHWAHRVRHRFKDGDLYLNLRGYDPGPPVTPLEALDRLLRALDVPSSRIPLDLDARVSMLRTVLSGRQVLIVLDNARDAEQVRPLLPGSPGCFVVVTSRSRLPGLIVRDGAHRITLDVLKHDDALMLLRSIIGASRVDAETRAAGHLARRCASLPLALRIAAELAVSRPQAPLSELGAELAEGSGRLDALATADEDEATAVREVFSWSLRGLPTPARRTFTLLGLHPGPDISAPAAAALTGATIAQARKHLDALSNAQLLEVTLDRYRFHDLLRDYAAELVGAEETEEDRAAAVARLCAWYLAMTTATASLLATSHARPIIADRPHSPGRGLPDSRPTQLSTPDQALAWCKTELANLAAITRLTVTTGDDSTARHLAGTLRSFFQMRKPFSEWLTISRLGREAACRSGDRPGEAAMLSSLGGAYLYLGRNQEALNSHQQALQIHRELGTQPRTHESGIPTALILVNLAECYRSSGLLADALDCLNEALTIARETNDPASEGHALEVSGDVHRDLGQNGNAAEALRESLAIFRHAGLPYGQAMALSGLARLHHALGETEAALKHSQAAVEILRGLHDELEQVRSLGTLTTIYLALQQKAKARQTLAQAAAILQERNDSNDADYRTYLDDIRAELT